MRRERDDLRGQLSQRDTELQSLRAGPSTTRRRGLRALAYVTAAIAGAIMSAMVFDRTVYRPMQATLQDSIAGLDIRVKQEEADNQRLQTALAEAQGALASVRNVPTGPPAMVESPQTDDLAPARKVLADKMAAVDFESKRLAQVKRDLDLENDKLVATRTTLEKDRASFQLERKTQAAIIPAMSPNAGVLIWRGTTGSTTAQTAVMVTMNKSNFGTVRGSLPGREASLEIIVRQGTVKIFERPDASNKWSRFYFQVQGAGPALVYVIWTVTG